MSGTHMGTRIPGTWCVYQTYQQVRVQYASRFFVVSLLLSYLRLSPQNTIKLTSCVRRNWLKAPRPRPAGGVLPSPAAPPIRGFSPAPRPSFDGPFSALESWSPFLVESGPLLSTRCQSESNVLAAEAQRTYMHRKGQQLQAVVELAEGNVATSWRTSQQRRLFLKYIPGGKDETVLTIP